MGIMCLSLCVVSVVHPTVILDALFCIICSLLMFVPDASGDDMIETYSSMDLVMALYVASIVSVCFHHVVDMSGLGMLLSTHSHDPC